MSLDAATTAQVETFAEQLGAQAERYRALLALGERQRQALEGDDLAAFHELLGQKATLVAEIGAADEAAAQNRAVWDAHRDAVPEALRERLRAVVEEIRRALEQSLAVEQACEARLHAAKTHVAQDLDQVGRGRRALASYRPAPPPVQSRHLDLGGGWPRGPYA